MRKLIYVACISVVLMLASNAQAYTWYWCSSSGDWANTGTWMYGSGVPSLTEASQAILYGGANVSVTTAGCGCVNLALGYSTDWSNDLGTQSRGTLNIAQGIEWVQNGDECAIGHMGGHGTLNVNGTVDANGTVRMATGASYSTATMNVNDGGTFTGHYANVGEAGTAAINLNGTGNMTITGLNLYNGNGHIDIEAGQFKVLGDCRTDIQSYIDNGWITGYDGVGTVNAPIFENDYTVITATAGTLPCGGLGVLEGDINQDCYVNFKDFAIFAGTWLSCTDSANASCQ